MNLKIFISHKKEDELTALSVQQTLNEIGVDAYLDVLDNTVSEDGEKLTRHIREQLRKCSDVIVILSQNTKKSWWVPFEIGMATQKDMPIANYLVSYEKLPEYLEYWPRLKNVQDIRTYIRVRNEVTNQIRIEKSLNNMHYQGVVNVMSETQRFYSELKNIL